MNYVTTYARTFKLQKLPRLLASGFYFMLCVNAGRRRGPTICRGPWLSLDGIRAIKLSLSSQDWSYFGFMCSAELHWDGRPRELRLRVQQELWDVRAHRAKPSCIPVHDTFGVLDTVSGIKALVTKLLCKHQLKTRP